MEQVRKRINNEQELLELFCDPSDDRPYINKPCKDKDFVFATKLYMSIFIAPSLLSNEYMETAENLWHDAFERYGDRKTIRLKALKDVLSLLPQEKEVILTGKNGICEECEGFGWVKRQHKEKSGRFYRDEVKCSSCKGKGYFVNEKPTDFMRPIYYCSIEIDERTIRGSHIVNLQHVMEYFSVEECTYYLSTSGNFVFEVIEGVRVLFVSHESVDWIRERNRIPKVKTE